MSWLRIDWECNRRQNPTDILILISLLPEYSEKARQEGGREERWSPRVPMKPYLTRTQKKRPRDHRTLSRCARYFNQTSWFLLVPGHLSSFYNWINVVWFWTVSPLKLLVGSAWFLRRSWFSCFSLVLTSEENEWSAVWGDLFIRKHFAEIESSSIVFQGGWTIRVVRPNSFM